MLKRLLRAGMWVFLGILLGRIVGLVREMLVAKTFGTTAQADVAALLLTVPDTLINILIGGAMGAALIPEFQRLSPHGRWRLYRRASLAVALLFAPLTLLLAWQAEAAVRVFAPGFAPGTVALAVGLLQVSVWAVPIAAVAAVGRAFLQAGDRFALTSMTTLVYNLSLVMSLALGPDGARLSWLAVAAVAGAALGFAMQAWDAHRLRPAAPDEQDPHIDRGLAIRYGQAMLAGGLILTLPAIARALVSGESEGAFARLNFAIKMVELPLGLVLTVFAVVMFPAIAALFADPQRAGEGERLARQGMTMVLSLSVAIGLGMAWFARDFAWLLYGRGKVDDEGLAAIAALATTLLAGLAAQALYALVLSVLNARRDTSSPFYASLGGLALFFGLAFLLRPPLGEQAVAAAYAATHWAMLALLVAVARFRHGIGLSRAIVGPRALFGAGVIAAAFLALAWSLSPAFAHPGSRVLLAILLGLLALAAGVLAVADQRRAVTELARRLRERRSS
jgi:murein biosynthesis integral membrane protein MurJ